MNRLISIPCVLCLVIFLREVYSKSNKRYVVFGCSLCMQFLVNGMLSAVLGIDYVDIMEEFDSSASQVSLMLSLYRGITFGGSKLEVNVFN